MSKNLNFFFILFLTSYWVPVLAFAQSASRYYWLFYDIDRSRPVGAFTSLAIDSEGQPNVAYTKAEGQRGLKFCRYDGSSWRLEMVDPLGEGRLKMVLDTQNRPHIVYTTDEDSKVMYATRVDGTWQIREVATTIRRGQLFYDKSIQVDATGQVYLVYGTEYPSNGSVLIQMTAKILRQGDFTTAARIDSFANNGKWNALVLNASGLPVAAYFMSFGNPALAMLDNAGNWTSEWIENDDFQNDQGYYATLCLDQNGRYYVSFHNQTTAKIRLASGTPGNWQIEDVADLSGWTTYTTPSPMALDQVGTPYLGFYDRKNGDLKLAFKQNNAWHIEPVDTIGNVGEYADLAINDQNMPVISYYDRTRQILRLAVGSLTAPADSDGDGIVDYLETNFGTNALDLDSDDDGLSDGEEDANHDGRVEEYECDPLNPDSDGDGMRDGLELGRSVGISGFGAILGTDTTLFSGDRDPNSRTDPLNPDSDGDGLADSVEDADLDGAVAGRETDPNLPDTDGDGLADGIERLLGCDPLDRDSDDDGLDDLEEDENTNGVVDFGETSPLRFDSDGDGLGDGLEKGVTTAIPDPDGPGRLLATELTVFIPDADYYKNSNPLNPDTDGDGLADGEEDHNQNGAVDAGETDFLNPDSDHDGQNDGDESSFLSNPLDPAQRAQVQLLYQDNFNELSANWQVNDQGDREGPSDWLVFDGMLIQASNIWGGTAGDLRADPDKPGSYLLLSNFLGGQYKITFKLSSGDDDEIGLMFRYQDENNYLRFSINREYRYARVVRMANGQASVIAERDHGYTVDQWYEVTVFSVGARCQIFLGSQRIFDLTDAAAAPSTLAFYCWKNLGARFKDLKIVGSGTIASAAPAVPAFAGADFELLDAFPNPAPATVSMVLHTRQSAVIDFQVVDILGRQVWALKDVPVPAGSHPLVWDGKDAAGLVTASGNYFLRVQARPSNGSSGPIWQSYRKIVRLR